MKVSELIEVIAKKTGKTTKEIDAEMNVLFMSLDESIPEKERVLMARNKLQAQYRKQFASGAKEFTIIPIAVGNAIDMVAKARKEAIETAQKNPSLNISRNLIDEQGNPLYNTTQQKFQDMAERQVKQRFEQHPKGHLMDAKGNKYRGKAMPENDLNKMVIVAMDIGEGFIPGILRVRGEENNAIPIPDDFAEYKIMAVDTKGDNSKIHKINDTKNLNFTPTGKKLTDTEIIEVLSKVFKNNWMNLGEMDTWCEEHPDFDRFAVMKVRVTEIVPTASKSGWQIIRVEDDTLGFEDEKGNIISPITVFLGPDKKIEFPESSEIYLIGQPSVNDRGKSIGGMGIYVPKAIKDIMDGINGRANESDK